MSDNIFNPHLNVTADGVVIIPGMWAFDNNLDVVRVVEDRDSTVYKCCAVKNGPDSEAHGKGQVRISGAYFSDHSDGWKCPTSVGGRAACSHNHWFNVETATGSHRMMDGERLATWFNGKSAASRKWA